MEDHLRSSFDFLITHASCSEKTTNYTVDSFLINETL